MVAMIVEKLQNYAVFTFWTEFHEKKWVWNWFWPTFQKSLKSPPKSLEIRWLSFKDFGCFEGHKTQPCIAPSILCNLIILGSLESRNNGSLKKIQNFGNAKKLTWSSTKNRDQILKAFTQEIRLTPTLTKIFRKTEEKVRLAYQRSPHYFSTGRKDPQGFPEKFGWRCALAQKRYRCSTKDHPYFGPNP